MEETDVVELARSTDSTSLDDVGNEWFFLRCLFSSVTHRHRKQKNQTSWEGLQKLRMNKMCGWYDFCAQLCIAHSAGDIFWELLIDPNDLKSKVVYKVTSNEITGIVRWVTLAFQKAPGCSNFLGFGGPRLSWICLRWFFADCTMGFITIFHHHLGEVVFFFQAPDKQIQDSRFCSMLRVGVLLEVIVTIVIVNWFISPILWGLYKSTLSKDAIYNQFTTYLVPETTMFQWLF